MRSRHSLKLDTHSIIKLEAISFCDIRPDAGSQFQIIASWLKEPLRALIREAGLTTEQFAELLERAGVDDIFGYDSIFPRSGVAAAASAAGSKCPNN